MRENPVHIGHDHVLSFLKGGVVMVGSIHSSRGTKTSTITEWAKKYSLPLIKQASNVTTATERYIHLGEKDVQRLYQEARPNAKIKTYNDYSHGSSRPDTG